MIEMIEMQAKQCPCCGGKAEILKWGHREYAPTYSVRCKECGLTTGNYKSEEVAVERWNARKGEESDWIPCSERLPDTDDYILVSFENFSIPGIARYEANESGGAFYPGDEEESYVSFGLFVNAWKPLPEPYKEG